ncbi:MAG: SRPBCC family protein [Actinomycetota bacterium]
MAQTGSASIDINASPSVILEVVADIESYTTRMSAFQVAEVLERDDEGRPVKARFEVDARIKVMEYTLVYEYSDDGVKWHSVEGNVKEIIGSYKMVPQGDVTKVTYDYSIDPGFSVPGFLLKQGVKMMTSTALDDLKRTAES